MNEHRRFTRGEKMSKPLQGTLEADAETKALERMLERSKREAALLYLRRALSYSDLEIVDISLKKLYGLDHVRVLFYDGHEAFACVENMSIPTMIYETFNQIRILR